MIYETKIQNGQKFIVGHLFKGEEIQVGSHWISSSGGIVIVEEIKTYTVPKYNDQNDLYNWYDVYYFWEEKGERRTHNKDSFSFQCRYSLIVEDT
jgi:hypothetical protein